MAWTAPPPSPTRWQHYIGLRRTPETINKRYALYQKVTAADVETVAKKYFVDDNRTVATLRYKAEGAPEKTGAEKSE